MSFGAATTLMAMAVGAASGTAGAAFVPPANVFVGYADTVHGDSVVPSPWRGDPGVIFAGEASAESFDAGAVRVTNPSETDSLKVQDVSVDVGSFHYAIWGSFLPVSVPPGGHLVLTSTDGENFNTSDTGDGCENNGVIPVVHITIADSTLDYNDTDQILNTGGSDRFECEGLNEGNDWAAVSTPEADIAVSMIANPRSVTPGANAQFPTTVTNNGPDDATNVVLTDRLPGNGVFVEAIPTQGSCGEPDGRTLNCALGDLGPEQNAGVQIVVRTPSDPASVVNVASATADQEDPNSGNNRAKGTAKPCGTDCTGGWVDGGGTIEGPPVRGRVTQAATLTAPPSVTGALSSTNSETSPCREPRGFEDYGQVFIVKAPEKAEGKDVYVYKLRLVSSDDTSVGVPFHEPLRDIKLIRKCEPVPRCTGTRRSRGSFPEGAKACLFNVFRNMRTKIVTIIMLDVGKDPPIRGGG